MTTIALPYLIMPVMAAVVAAWAASHWTLAGAVATGALGTMFVWWEYETGALRVFLPLLTGAVVAGLALLPMLVVRPGVSVWTRMTVAMVITFLVHFLFIQYAIASR